MGGQPVGDSSRLECLAHQLESLVYLGLDSLQGLEQPVTQYPELEIVEEPVDLITIPGGQRQLSRHIRKRHRPNQIGELAVQDHRGQVCAQ